MSAGPGRGRMLLLLGSLYLAQGLPYGFLTQAVPVLLRLEGASLTTISGSRLLLLPWLLKVLWAPLVDRWHRPALGRRRSWLLPVQAASVLLFAAFALVPYDSVMTVLLWATFLTALLAATQDIATDGLAVTLLSPAQRGLGNGVQVAAYRLGMVVGGGALLAVFADAGWGVSAASMAGLLALASLPVLFWREPPSPAPVAGPPWAAMRAMLRRPGVKAWLGLLVGYKVGEQAGGSLVKPLLVDAGLDLGAIGWLGAIDSTASLAGALAGGLWTTRLGTRRALVVFGLGQAVFVAAWAWPALTGDALAAALVTIADGFVGSMATAALFTAMMERTRPADGGTEYTLQASVVLVAAFLGGGLAGPLADGVFGFLPGPAGYMTCFVLWAVITAMGAVLMRAAPAAVPLAAAPG